MIAAAKNQVEIDGFLSAETPWDGRGFGLLYIDPPWKYANWSDKAHGAAAAHYNGMNLEQLAELRVDRYADDDATIAMWATWPKLQEAFKLGEAWGLKYVTGFPWIKYVPSYADAYICEEFPGLPPLPNGSVEERAQRDRIIASHLKLTHSRGGTPFHVKQGIGFVVYQVSEPLLYWRKGSPGTRDADVEKFCGLLTGPQERVFWAPIRAHSQKPPEIRAQLRAEFPDVSCLEVFATEFAPGWTSWGHAIGSILTKDGVHYADPSCEYRWKADGARLLAP